MRRHVTRVETTLPADDILDTAGTGGAPKTFNVSTAALVAAGAGINVAKHGNRSRRGRGSAEDGNRSVTTWSRHRNTGTLPREGRFVFASRFIIRRRGM